jgi:hypothetical protein
MESHMKMKKLKIINWSLSGVFSAILLFSAYYTSTEVRGFRLLGFPDYFRVELVVGKILGAILLLIPQVPQRIREWIYAAFGINLVSAFIAKLNSGYSLAEVLIDPGITFVVIIILIIYMDKYKKLLNIADGQ